MAVVTIVTTQQITTVITATTPLDTVWRKILTVENFDKSELGKF